MIEFDDVTRCYGDKIAVEQLSLVVSAGELFAYLGPNGAGKTTTIKMLVGLLRPTSGTLRVCGHDMADWPRAARRLVGYVPDEPFLYEKLSGREFLRFVAEMYGTPTAEVDTFIQREVERFELGEFVDSLAETYSHGMKQRTVFASAMLHDPPVLVIDEPMVGLDPRSARIVKDLLREQVAGGTTVFMSTHTLAVAEEIADRIGIICNGRLERVGTLGELLSDAGTEYPSLEEAFLDVTQRRQVGHASVESVGDVLPELGGGDGGG
ncbi:MAG: ABC transporter ATP-binding protein [Pirellulales bacterium]|nr:ABC transporter ATP-binding protein [Planctomycetales bacterium]